MYNEIHTVTFVALHIYTYLRAMLTIKAETHTSTQLFWCCSINLKCLKKSLIRLKGNALNVLINTKY